MKHELPQPVQPGIDWLNVLLGALVAGLIFSLGCAFGAAFAP